MIRKLKRGISYTAYALTIYNLPWNVGSAPLSSKYDPLPARQCYLSTPSQLTRPFRVRVFWKQMTVRAVWQVVKNFRMLYGGRW